MKKFRGIGLLAASMFLVAAGSAHAKSWVVGPGPNVDFHFIGQAVTAAKAGDSVLIMAGLYRESVSVNKTIHILGINVPGDRYDAYNCGSVMRTGNPTREAVIEPPTTGYGLALLTNNIEVGGVSFAGNGVDAMGIYCSGGASGCNIHDNFFTNLGTGIDANCSTIGSNTMIVHNAFNTNDNTTIAGTGTGITSTQGTHDAVIDHNAFCFNPSAAIVLFPQFGATSSNVNITSNTSVSDGNFLAIHDGFHIKIENNMASNPNHAQIGIGGCFDVTISHNMLVKGWRGIKVFAGFGECTDLDIHDNTISNQTDAAIGLDPDSVNSSEIDHNNCTNNRVGIRATAGDTSLFIHDNTLRNNTFLDAEDNSVGSYTAGTANLWQNNHGASDNKGGQLVRWW